MPVDPFWETIHLTNVFEYERAKEFYFKQPADFQPGDIAIAKGGILSTYYEWLSRRGYQLWRHEINAHRHTADRSIYRYCIVLERLGQNRYVICFLATFGQVKSYRDIYSVVGRHFGLPIGDVYWPGIPRLKTTPPWRGRRGTFIFGIPVLRTSLLPPTHSGGSRLFPDDLTRLRKLVEANVKAFDSNSYALRKEQCQQYSESWHTAPEELNPKEGKLPDCDNPIVLPYRTPRYPKARRLFSDSASEAKATHGDRQLDSDAAVVTPHRIPRDANTLRHTVHWLPPTSTPNDATWLYRYMYEDIKNRSIYLNSVIPRMPQTQFTKLPAPFFAPSLRAGIAHITRLIR